MQCPVCAKQLDVSQLAFEIHVNQHFQEGVDDIGTSPRKRRGLEDGHKSDDTCFVCGISIGVFDDTARQRHANSCLDRSSKSAGAGPSASRDNSFWETQPVDKGDRWWDQSVDNSSTLPENFSPRVIKTLATILATTHARNVTRSAVLCHAGVIHMQGVWMFDKTWGCGYRNTLMALSALFEIPAYKSIFAEATNGSVPGVRRVQGWIEEAWSQGFDTIGRDQLQGKLVGTRKWIGVSDIAAMFTSKGIPCELYDFAKPKKNDKTGKPTHEVLQEWVVAYFNDSSLSTSVYDILMSSSAVKKTDKMPLILQHSGHSRTIVGYEVNNRGDTNLLLFDPAKAIPKDIRKSSLPAYDDKHDSTTSPSSKRQKLNLKEDEEADVDGWIRKKGVAKSALNKQSDPVKALKTFRINLSALSSHTEYQILAFPGGPVLSQEERAARMRLSSHIVDR